MTRSFLYTLLYIFRFVMDCKIICNRKMINFIRLSYLHTAQKARTQLFSLMLVYVLDNETDGIFCITVQAENYFNWYFSQPFFSLLNNITRCQNTCAHFTRGGAVGTAIAWLSGLCGPKDPFMRNFTLMVRNV